MHSLSGCRCDAVQQSRIFLRPGEIGKVSAVALYVGHKNLRQGRNRFIGTVLFIRLRIGGVGGRCWIVLSASEPPTACDALSEEVWHPVSSADIDSETRIAAKGRSTFFETLILFLRSGVN